MKHFKNKLRKLSTPELRLLEVELEGAAASCATICDTIYDRLFCISVELVDRAVAKIPNATKYIYNYKTLEVEVFFDHIHSTKFSIKALKKG